MEIKIQELKNLGSLELNYLEKPEKVEVSSPELLNVNLVLKYHLEYIAFTGKIKGNLFLDCSRCLETFLYPLEIQFSSQLLLTETNGKILDISQEIRQQIILNLPLKPLCQNNCQGLCPQCGQNLNFEKCNCLKKEEWYAKPKKKTFKITTG